MHGILILLLIVLDSTARHEEIFSLRVSSTREYDSIKRRDLQTARRRLPLRESRSDGRSRLARVNENENERVTWLVRIVWWTAVPVLLDDFTVSIANQLTADQKLCNWRDGAARRSTGKMRLITWPSNYIFVFRQQHVLMYTRYTIIYEIFFRIYPIWSGISAKFSLVTYTIQLKKKRYIVTAVEWEFLSSYSSHTEYLMCSYYK